MRRSGTFLQVLARCLIVACALGSAPLLAQSVLTVNALDEPVGGITSASCTASCTLRDAFNSAASGDTIRFAPTLDGQAITLTLFSNDISVGSTEFGPSAFFLHNKTLTIDAATGLTQGITLARDTNAAEFRLFDVDAGSDLTLRGLTLQNGVAHGGGSDLGGAALGAGGAIFNQGLLTVDRCTLAGNQARGGDIFATSFSIFSNGAGGGAGQDTIGAGGGPNGGANAPNGGNGGFGGGGGQSMNGQAGAGGFGGGGGANFTQTGGLFLYSGGSGGIGGFGGGGGGEGPAGGFGGGQGHANTGGGGSGGGMGGAIFNDAGTVAIVNSTLTGNTAAGGLNRGNGGAQGSASGGNGSGFGGAVFNYAGSLYLTFVTVSGNSVSRGIGGQGGLQDGGGIYSLGDQNCGTGGNPCGDPTARVVLVHSILANSIGTSADVVADTIHGATSSGFGKGNLVMSARTVNGGTLTIDTLSSANPQLGVLGANGAFGQTLVPAAGSPAIDLAGDCTDGIGIAVGNDQRGLPRPYGATCDVGAVEVQPLPQAIMFTSFVSGGQVGGSYAVSASGGPSGNPVVFSVAGPCTVSGSTITFIGTGNCVISANQAGNATYYAAATVQQTIFIGHAQCVVNTNADDATGASAKVTNASQYLWNYGSGPFDVTLRDCILAANLMTGTAGAPTGSDGQPATTAQTDPAMYIFFNASAIADPTLVLDDELPLIYNNVTIDASMLPQPMTIDGAHAHRIFFVSGLPSNDPATFINGHADPDGTQPLLVTLNHFVLQNALARGGCSGSGGAGMGAGAALFVNHAAQVELIDASFANNTAQGGDTSGIAESGGSAGAGMGSRSVGGAAGGLGNVGAGDGQNCTAVIAGADTQNGRGIGTNGFGNAGGGFGGSGLGQIGATQNFTNPLFGGGTGVVSGIGGSGGIGGGGHYGASGNAGSGGFGAGGGDGEGPSGGAYRGGDGGFGGGGGYGVGNGGSGGFGGGGGAAAALTAGHGGFGGGGGGTGGSENGSTFVAGGFGGGRGYINGGAGAAFGAAMFVRDGGTLTLHARHAQSISGGHVIAGVGNNGLLGGTDLQRGAGTARGEGVFLQGSAATQFDVDAGVTLAIADTITGDCANGNTANLAPPAVCVDGGTAKTGAGTLLLSGTSTYNGPTLIAAGTLQLDGALLGGTSGNPAPTQASSVVVDGGTLGGSGYAAGALTLASGSIAPGGPGSPGTLHAGTLNWQPGGTLALRLGAGNAGSDHLLLDGALLRSGSGPLRFHFSNGAGVPVPGTVYTLISAGAAGNFSAADLQADVDVAFSGQFAIVGNTVQFTLGALVADRIFANGFE